MVFIQAGVEIAATYHLRARSIRLRVRQTADGLFSLGFAVLALLSAYALRVSWSGKFSANSENFQHASILARTGSKVVCASGRNILSLTGKLTGYASAE
jgi:hypothetical protein